MKAGVALAAVLLSLSTVASAETASRAEGLAQWKRIEAVLKHPRCINCHTITDYPRQGDDRVRHRFRILRGPDNKGAPGASCSACHQAQNQANGVPGAAGWHLAPLSMAWESRPGVIMSGAQLCRTVLDRQKNHGMDVAKLERHFADDPFIQWAWSPGADIAGTPRAVPPITHAELMDAFHRWAGAGTPCPG
jgi:hypothetical protein